MKDKHFIVVTKDDLYLNYGQTGNVIGFDEFSDEVYFKPHGSDKTYKLHYTQVWWPSEQEIPNER